MIVLFTCTQFTQQQYYSNTRTSELSKRISPEYSTEFGEKQGTSKGQGRDGSKGLTDLATSLRNSETGPNQSLRLVQTLILFSIPLIRSS